jgi:hypothetical protein
VYWYEVCPESKIRSRIASAQVAWGGYACAVMSQEPKSYIRHIVSSHSLFISSSFCLEMNMKIENPTSCEIRSVIKFLNAKNVRPAEIYRQVCKVYGENAVSDGMVRRWCRTFSEGRTNVHEVDRRGRPSLITTDLLIMWMGRLEKTEDSPCLSWVHISRTFFSDRPVQQR